MNVKVKGGVAFFDSFSVVDATGALVTGLANSAFTKELAKAGVNNAGTVTVSEVNAVNEPGQYRFTFTPSAETGQNTSDWRVRVRTATHGICADITVRAYSVDYGGFASSQGTGEVSVNHDTGGADNLKFQTSGAAGIDNAIVRAYLESDWNAGNTGDGFLKGQAVTNTNGRWVNPIFLAAGAYAIVFSLATFQVATKSLTVS